MERQEVLRLVQRLQETVRADLWGRTLPFWLRHSIDRSHGGYFNCLDEDGTVTETTKHVWLQGRQVWMLARLANSFTDGEIDKNFERYCQQPEGRLSRAALIEAAVQGADFLHRHAIKRRADGSTELVYFALAADGTPALYQRKIFSATFVIMGLAEAGRAGQRPDLWQAAVQLLETVLEWIKTPEALGKPGLPGMPAMEPLNVPMILLNVIMELRECISDPAERRNFFEAERVWAVAGITKHVSPEHRATFEFVTPDGRFDFSTMDGRLLNPGHAIEAGWFLLSADAALEGQALQVIDWAFEAGWDGDLGNGTVGRPAVGRSPDAPPVAGTGRGAGSGGMIYFQDVRGLSPSQLEWPMKLWWPQAEAMIAFAMAFAQTLDPVHLQRLQTVMDWTYSHLVDHVHGEWYGYADRSGAVTHRFKGGAYKGCFHVPRALLYVDRALEQALQRLQQA